MLCKKTRANGKRAVLVILSAVLTTCTTYTPLPLDKSPQLKGDISELQATDESGKPMTLDANTALSMHDFILLVLQNNPDLKVSRADRQLAKAQVLQAGLLPNPQLNGSYSYLLGGPGTFDAWTAGITEDIRALVTLSAHEKGAQYDAMKVDAELLWEEWQTIGKARLLYIDIVEGTKQIELLTEAYDLLAEHYERDRQALSRGNITLTVMAPDLTALSDVHKQLDELNRQHREHISNLNALLGLSASVKLKLSGAVDFLGIDITVTERLLADLPNRRPDLVALQLGYNSQEQGVRVAVLSQFPVLNFGGNWGSDTSHVRTGGPQITLELPIFNHNQGNIAIEQATRQKLHDEFSNRVASAIGEAEASLVEQSFVERQLDATKAHLNDAELVGTSADVGFKNGDIDARTYIDLVMVRVNKKQELVTLEQTLLEQQVALATLLGVGMPEVKMTTEVERKK